MRILIAEDDATSRLLLRATLKKLGHEVVAVADGKEAWDALQAEHFPVLISDWLMPGWDCPTLCRAIRQEDAPQYTLILMLTALGGKSNYLEAMNAGADDYLTKPVDEDQLVARLQVAQRILRLHTHVKQLEGLLPICSYCKRIRNGANGWDHIESYIARRTEARFSHGVCPECAKKLLPAAEANAL
jgi:sigma-B regulation protein RsbU (phosphoserine phosphatase)